MDLYTIKQLKWGDDPDPDVEGGIYAQAAWWGYGVAPHHEGQYSADIYDSDGDWQAQFGTGTREECKALCESHWRDQVRQFLEEVDRPPFMAA